MLAVVLAVVVTPVVLTPVVLAVVVTSFVVLLALAVVPASESVAPPLPLQARPASHNTVQTEIQVERIGGG